MVSLTFLKFQACSWLGACMPAVAFAQNALPLQSFATSSFPSFSLSSKVTFSRRLPLTQFLFSPLYLISFFHAFFPPPLALITNMLYDKLICSFYFFVSFMRAGILSSLLTSISWSLEWLRAHAESMRKGLASKNSGVSNLGDGEIAVGLAKIRFLRKLSWTERLNTWHLQ